MDTLWEIAMARLIEKELSKNTDEPSEVIRRAIAVYLEKLEKEYQAWVLGSVADMLKEKE